MRDMKNNVWTCVRLILYFIVIFAIVLCAKGRMNMRCIFLEKFGFTCPTCGATRATFAMLSGNILSAIEYNAFYSLVIFPFVVIFILEDFYVIITRSIFKKSKFSLIEIMFGGKV